MPNSDNDERFDEGTREEDISRRADNDDIQRQR
jgi:hypothetical protein